MILSKHALFDLNWVNYSSSYVYLFDKYLIFNSRDDMVRRFGFDSFKDQAS